MEEETFSCGDRFKIKHDGEKNATTYIVAFVHHDFPTKTSTLSLIKLQNGNRLHNPVQYVEIDEDHQAPNKIPESIFYEMCGAHPEAWKTRIPRKGGA